jgi:hypothetical protein
MVYILEATSRMRGGYEHILISRRRQYAAIYVHGPTRRGVAEGYVMARGSSIATKCRAAGIAKADAQLVGESYVRKDAAGGQTRLAVRNDLDDTSAYAAIVRGRRIVTLSGCWATRYTTTTTR